MQFFSSAIDTLQTLVVALGAGLGGGLRGAGNGIEVSLLGTLVGEQEAFWGEMPAPVGLLRPALSAELLQPGLERSEVHKIGAAVLLLVDALHGAQAQHQIFSAPLPLGNDLRFVNDIAALEHPLDIGIQIPHKGVPPKSEWAPGPKPM